MKGGALNGAEGGLAVAPLPAAAALATSVIVGHLALGGLVAVAVAERVAFRGVYLALGGSRWWAGAWQWCD